MNKVLITGGAGFIGYHLSKHLANEGDEVTIVDNLSRGKMDEELYALITMKNVKYLDIDLTKREPLENLDKNYDHIYHLAAINGTRYFYEIPDKVLRTNILSTINILDWFIQTRCKKILFTSSSETYSGTIRKMGSPIPTPEGVFLGIEDVKNPRWSYAGSKIIGELLFINYARRHGFDMTIVRYHNIYGPRMGYEHVIPQFLLRIYNKTNPFPIYGNSTRAFCYVDDAVQATKLAMKKKNCTGEVIHIGNDSEEKCMVDLARIMFETLNYEAKIEVHPAPMGCVKRRCPNIDKLKKLTGYVPKIDLKKGISLTHEYYIKHNGQKSKNNR